MQARTLATRSQEIAYYESTGTGLAFRYQLESPLGEKYRLALFTEETQG